MFAVILYCDTHGWVEFNREREGWMFRFTDEGAVLAEGVGLDPMKDFSVYLFTMLVARCDDALPEVVTDAALQVVWQEDVGSDFTVGVEKLKELITV